MKWFKKFNLLFLLNGVQTKSTNWIFGPMVDCGTIYSEGFFFSKLKEYKESDEKLTRQFNDIKYKYDELTKFHNNLNKMADLKVLTYDITYKNDKSVKLNCRKSEVISDWTLMYNVVDGVEFLVGMVNNNEVRSIIITVSENVQ